MKKIWMALLLVCFLASSFGAYGTLRVKRPNGGNGWAAGSTKPIKWYHSKTDTIKIELLKGGKRFLTIKDSLNTADSTYNWVIPAGLPEALDYRIKISNYNNRTTKDSSDNNFDILYNPNVKIVAPNGGEVLRKDRPFTITWTTNLRDSLQIDLLKAGSHVSKIAHVLATSNSYIWSVPAGIASGIDYKIRIRHLDVDSTAIADSSFDDIEIAPIPFTISTPSASGIKWVKGSTRKIYWAHTSLDSVKLELFKNNVIQTPKISPSFGGATDSLSWTIPKSLASGADYKVKITSKTSASNVDESNYAFGLYDSLYTSSLVSDKKSGSNAAKLVRRDSTFAITWVNATTNLPASDSIKINLYKAGVYNRVIARTLATPASYTWTVPSALVAAADYSIKIMSIKDSLIFNDSTKVFPISDPAINIISPNGGEYLTIGALDSIRFATTASAGARFKIDLYKGTALSRVLKADTTMSAAPGRLAIPWTPLAASVEGYDYKIKISSLTNTKLSDMSSTAFALVKAPAVTITSPNGGEVYYRGGSYNVVWNQNFNDSVLVAYYKNDVVVDTIATVKPSTSIGTYAWTIPNSEVMGFTYKVKVWRKTSTGVRDSSDANFKIVESPIRVTSVDAADSTWLKGSSHFIRWASTDVPEDVKIELIKQGSTALPIVVVASAPNNNDGANGSIENSFLGKYYWTIPKTGVAAGTYKFKVSSIITATAADLSNKNVIIADPDGISVMAPDAASLKLLKGNSYNITWSDNIAGKVKIDLLTAGVHSSTITDSTASSGSYVWNIPTTLADGSSYKVRVRSYKADSSAVTDSSSNNFQLATAPMILTAPNGPGKGAWTKDSTVYVKWTATASGWAGGIISGKVKIEVLKGSTVVYTHAVQPNAAAGRDSINFKIPTTWTVGADYKARVTGLANATYTDMSDSAFTVQYAWFAQRDANKIIKEFKLEQNYPNPFNSLTEIVYAIPTGYNDQVSMNIYNAKGELVRKVLNRVHTGGIYSVRFDAASFGSGIYYYVVDGKNFKDIKRMVLLK